MKSSLADFSSSLRMVAGCRAQVDVPLANLKRHRPLESRTIFRTSSESGNSRHACQSCSIKRWCEIAQKDSRYSYEAYEFLFEALSHTQDRLAARCRTSRSIVGPEHHVPDPNSLKATSTSPATIRSDEPICLAVLGHQSTDDIGEVVLT